jgi:transposase
MLPGLGSFARVFVCLKPIDFRKGIDGMVSYCNRELGRNPRDGAIFCFSNRSKTSIKILYYDSQGYWLCQKRLSAGKLRYWPTEDSDTRAKELSLHELTVIIYDGSLEKTDFRAPFCKVG